MGYTWEVPALDPAGQSRAPRVQAILQDLRGRALWVVLGCLVCQLGLGLGYVFAPLSPYILEELGWTRGFYASARAPQVWTIALVTPAIGALVARFGARAVVAPAVLMLSASLWLFAGMNELWQLSALTIVFGLGMAGVGDVAMGAVVVQWVSRARGLALGLVYIGSNLGGMGFAALAGWRAEAVSWRGAFYDLSLLALVAMLPFALWSVREPRPGERRVEQPGAGEVGPEADGDRDLRLAQAARTRSFWIIGFGLFCFFFYFVGMLEHVVLYLTDVGLDRTEAAAYFSAQVGIGIAGKLLFGLVADRMRPRDAVLVNTALLVLSSLLIQLAPRWGVVPAFVALFGFATAARDVTYPVLIADCFGPRHLAEVYGMLMVVLLGSVAGPIVAGFVHDATGSYGPAFALFAALNALAFAGLCFVRDERAPRP